MNFNWLILLQASLRPYGNQDFFGVNGEVTIVYKLKSFSYTSARMGQNVLCYFERRLGETKIAIIKRLRKWYTFTYLSCRAEHSFC